ncbi:hypothetical protein BC834DRAFT_975641 [Gloeopeniophorella convolvens]|nr:hypothetical protein BC834DRAFT_975641 [Gloeopeniophorella convolvens]
MLWGCLAAGKKGPLIWLELGQEIVDDAEGGTGKSKKGGLNGSRYVSQVLEGPLKQFYEELNMERGGGMLVVEDGAPAHSSRFATTARARLGIHTLTHPPGSPDLNCIEPIWSVLKDRVADIPGSGNSLDNLWAAVQLVWDALTVDEMEKMAGSMEERASIFLDLEAQVDDRESEDEVDEDDLNDFFADDSVEEDDDAGRVLDSDNENEALSREAENLDSRVRELVGRYMRRDGYGDQVPQHLLHPTSADHELYMVKVKLGLEETLVSRIASRCLSPTESRPPLAAAVFARRGIPGHLFIEGPLPEVERARRGLVGFMPGSRLWFLRTNAPRSSQHGAQWELS